MYSLEDTECRHCGEGFGEGDDALVVWNGTARHDGNEMMFQESSLDFYHSKCASVGDRRPPVVPYLVYENRDGVDRMHIVGHSGKSRCGALGGIDPDAVERERARPEGIAADEDAELCSGCKKSFRGDHR